MLYSQTLMWRCPTPRPKIWNVRYLLFIFPILSSLSLLKFFYKTYNVIRNFRLGHLFIRSGLAVAPPCPSPPKLRHCLLACLYVCLFVCLLACFTVCLFVCLLACLFVCLFVCLFASFLPSINCLYLICRRWHYILSMRLVVVAVVVAAVVLA